MNGIHDLGGMHGFGPVEIERDEPVFHEGWEGRVLVEMHLEVDGRLAEVRLLQRSGYAVLDEATITAVRRAAPFPPIARRLEVPVEYRLVP